ncbi:MAG: hypothetical protein KAY37_02030 [Phycisphaerae bacterium]|nr:hypothetical protein [Phycisphaerae bacterium]
MNRAEYEQLVCAWLDEPGREDLRARVVTAAQADPEFTRLLDEWCRFDELLRRGLPEPHGVAWARFKEHLAAALDDDVDRDDVLDQALRGLQPIDDCVDWPRMRGRIVSALTGREGSVTARTARRNRWITAGAALLAAAAVLLFSFMPEAGSGAGSPGLAVVTVSRQPAAELEPNGGEAYARITVEVAAVQPEFFFSIDPITTAGPSDETADLY